MTEKAGAEHFQGVTVQPMIKLKDAYELIIGSSLDPQFGPVLLFGTGGQLVEVFKDRALALPPLNSHAGAPHDGADQDLQGAERRSRPARRWIWRRSKLLLVRFSALVAEQRWIKEIDINPLLASPDGLIALDARVVVHGPEVTLEQVPDDRHPAVSDAVRGAPGPTKDGTQVDHPADPSGRRAGDGAVSTRRSRERSVYLRYFHLMNLEQRTTHERLTRICFIDYDREMALVAERRNPRPVQPKSSAWAA